MKEWLFLISRGDRYLSHSSRHTQVPVPLTNTFTLVASMYRDLPLYWIMDPAKDPTPKDFQRFDTLFRHII